MIIENSFAEFIQKTNASFKFIKATYFGIMDYDNFEFYRIQRNKETNELETLKYEKPPTYIYELQTSERTSLFIDFYNMGYISQHIPEIPIDIIKEDCKYVIRSTDGIFNILFYRLLEYRNITRCNNSEELKSYIFKQTFNLAPFGIVDCYIKSKHSNRVKLLVGKDGCCKLAIPELYYENKYSKQCHVNIPDEMAEQCQQMKIKKQDIVKQMKIHKRMGKWISNF